MLSQKKVVEFYIFKSILKEPYINRIAMINLNLIKKQSFWLKSIRA